MQSAQQSSIPEDSKSINALPTATIVDEQPIAVPTNQLFSTVSNNSLSPATTTTCSSNDSSTNTSATVAEPRPSIIPFSVSGGEQTQQNVETSPPPTQESSVEPTPLPSIQPTPHMSEKKLSTASAAPMLQHVLPTHQPLADIRDLETALSTTLGIHRSVSVAPTFPPFSHIPPSSDTLNAIIDQPTTLTAMAAAAALQQRLDSNPATNHDDAIVESASIDPHAHQNLFNGSQSTGDQPRFSIESSRPASAQSPLIAEELHTCENCQVALMENRVFCGLDCAQSFAMMQVR